MLSPPTHLLGILWKVGGNQSEITILSRPVAFARYRAWSARLNHWVASSSVSRLAKPNETVTIPAGLLSDLCKVERILCIRASRFFFVYVGQQQYKLFSTVPEYLIGATNTAFNQAGQINQNTVTHAMPISVINYLEMIDIQNR